MLTRSQVAKRLGKSIATVRRLEGDRLHPRRDEAGVHRFDAAEVERLAKARAPGRAALVRLHPSKWAAAPRTRAATEQDMGGGAGIDRHHEGALSRYPDSSTNSLERAPLYERLQALEDEFRKRAANSRALARQNEVAVARIARELIAMAHALPDRALRRIDAEILAMLTTLVNAEDPEH